MMRGKKNKIFHSRIIIGFKSTVEKRYFRSHSSLQILAVRDVYS